MKTVKLTAKKDTFYKEGTEVFHYDHDYEEERRICLQEFDVWQKSETILVRGIHTNDDGEDVIYGDYCTIDSFDVEILEENE